MSDRKLTPKQEKFVESYIETGNSAEAYRRAYSAEKMSPQAIWVEGTRLLQHPVVALRLKQRQAQEQERTGVTVEWLTDQLKTVLAKAMGEGKGASAAVSALMGMAKLHGLIVEKQNVTSDNRHHHSAEPLSPFAAHLENVLGTGAEGAPEGSVPN